MPIRVLMAAAVLLVCVTMGPNIAKHHFMLDTLSHFRVQYAVKIVILGAFFGFFRRGARLVLSLVGLIVNPVPIVPWYVAKNEWLAADSSHSIKILV